MPVAKVGASTFQGAAEVTPGISLREYAERIAALQRTVADADLDCFVVSSFDNIYYLSAYSITIQRTEPSVYEYRYLMMCL